MPSGSACWRTATRIQLDLVPTFQIDGISLENAHRRADSADYQRVAGRTIYVDFPHTLRKGQIYTVDFHYSGHPVEMGRFGGFVFRKDPMGRPLVNTACEEEGASVWWPNKDQWRDEVESMDISVEAPSDLVEVSGGRFQKQDRSARRIHALGLEGAVSNQQLRCLAQHRNSTRTSATPTSGPEPRLLRLSRRPRKGEASVRAGEGHAEGVRALLR